MAGLSGGAGGSTKVTSESPSVKAWTHQVLVERHPDTVDRRFRQGTQLMDDASTLERSRSCVVAVAIASKRQ